MNIFCDVKKLQRKKLEREIINKTLQKTFLKVRCVLVCSKLFAFLGNVKFLSTTLIHKNIQWAKYFLKSYLKSKNKMFELEGLEGLENMYVVKSFKRFRPYYHI